MHEMKVSVKCPVCGKRICDKIPGASGRIQLKCRECDRVVWINLEYRAPVGRCFPVPVMAAGCGAPSGNPAIQACPFRRSHRTAYVFESHCK